MAAWSRWVGGRARWPFPRRLLRRHLSQARILGAPASCGTSAPSAELWHVSEALAEGLTRLGVKTPNAVQAEAIPLAVSGRDVLVVSQTGSGKTLMFLLPILQRLSALAEADAAVGASASCDAAAVVLAPTAALASQHMAVARQLAAGLPTPPIIASLESLDLDSLDTESIDTDAESIDTEGAGSPQSQPRSQSQPRPRSRPRARARLLIGTPECWLARPDLGLGSSTSTSTSSSTSSPTSTSTPTSVACVATCSPLPRSPTCRW